MYLNLKQSMFQTYITIVMFWKYVQITKREEPMDKEKQEAAKEQVASLFADTFHNMSQHGLQINMQKQAFQVA